MVTILASNEEMIEELRKIRMLLETKPAPPPPPPPKGLWNEFKDFLGKFKVVGLAVAFILGLYLGIVIQALVKDILLPVIGLALPGIGDLATLSVAVGSQTFGIGDFLVAVITFIIVAFVVFILVKIAKRMKLLDM